MELLRFELIKLFHRPRTFLSLFLMIILIGLIFWGLYSEGATTLDYALKALNQNFVVQGKILNAYLVIYFILNTLWIHVPVLLVIVTSDLMSSELESGTIRILLTRPLNRHKLLLIKFLTAVLFVFLFMLVWTFVSFFPAIWLFGKGDLVVLFNGLQIIEEKFLFQRFLSAFGFAFAGMASFAIFSVALSIFTRKSLVTILLSLGFLVISTLLQTLAPTLFHGWESFLLTHHLAQWQLFFYSDIDYMEINRSLTWLFFFTLICILASLWKFNRLKITE